jgi:hypothetical protein
MPDDTGYARILKQVRRIDFDLQLKERLALAGQDKLEGLLHNSFRSSLLFRYCFTWRNKTPTSKRRHRLGKETGYRKLQNRLEASSKRSGRFLAKGGSGRLQKTSADIRADCEKRSTYDDHADRNHNLLINIR